MPDLVVDLAGLAALAAQLRRITGGMDATDGQVAAARADLGSDDVADALGGFDSRWDDGRKKIAENGTTLATMVEESVKAYRATDDQLAAGLRTSGQ